MIVMSMIQITVLIPLRNLETQASQNGFTIHNVPYDGDCMFSAIVYQLNSSGVCDFDSKALRQAVVDYLHANQARYYCDFVCQPVDQHDDYNADTDPGIKRHQFGAKRVLRYIQCSVIF